MTTSFSSATAAKLPNVPYGSVIEVRGIPYYVTENYRGKLSLFNLNTGQEASMPIHVSLVPREATPEEAAKYDAALKAKYELLNAFREGVLVRPARSTKSGKTIPDGLYVVTSANAKTVSLALLGGGPGYRASRELLDVVNPADVLK